MLKTQLNQVVEADWNVIKHAAMFSNATQLMFPQWDQLTDFSECHTGLDLGHLAKSGCLTHRLETVTGNHKHRCDNQQQETHVPHENFLKKFVE
jgi:hypothetical protein